jgi:hypothetical protein
MLALTNVGGAPVSVTGIASSNPAEFAIAGSTCGNVATGASCEFAVTVSVASAGARSVTITIASNGAGNPQWLGASGTGMTTTPPPPGTADLIESHYAQWDDGCPKATATSASSCARRSDARDRQLTEGTGPNTAPLRFGRRRQPILAIPRKCKEPARGRLLARQAVPHYCASTHLMSDFRSSPFALTSG